MKKEIIDLLSIKLEGILTAQEIEKLVETPPSDEIGDYALPCFFLAKKMRKSPASIAEELKHKLAGEALVAKTEAVSGYLNIFIDKTVLSEKVLRSALSEEFGKVRKQRNVTIEYLSPNTNKPLHLGHLRNIAIGKSLASILSFCGNQVSKVSINNDRGVHICKSMLAYQRFGDGVTPEKINRKPDHFVGDFYVLFNEKAKQDETLPDQAQALLKRWESGDPATRELWSKMNRWAFQGFEETYRLFGVKFDKEYYESRIFEHGKEIILDGCKAGAFCRKENGAIAANLEDLKLGEKILLRSDGTSVYIVQDLYLAKLKYDDFKYDLSIYVVGNEQEYHFKVLIAILKKLGSELADKIYHLSYGMVELPEGKMKSREGTVVDADDLIHETKEISRKEIEKRYDLSEVELEERSLSIALAAITYQLLKTDTSKNITFNPKEAIKFEGDTGPYLLYSYARAASILRKSGGHGEYQIPEPGPYEIKFIKKLSMFPEAVGKAYEKLSPSPVANYAFEFAQVFNEFYHHCPVLKSEHKDFRLAMVKAFCLTIKQCLHLMGVSAIEEM
jgi:arginyl-tRNA synthetase